MPNDEMEFRCRIAYEQLEKIFHKLISYHKIDEAEKVSDIMRQIIIFSQIFNKED